MKIFKDATIKKIQELRKLSNFFVHLRTKNILNAFKLKNTT